MNLKSPIHYPREAYGKRRGETMRPVPAYAADFNLLYHICRGPGKTAENLQSRLFLSTPNICFLFLKNSRGAGWARCLHSRDDSTTSSALPLAAWLMKTYDWDWSKKRTRTSERVKLLSLCPVRNRRWGKLSCNFSSVELYVIGHPLLSQIFFSY